MRRAQTLNSWLGIAFVAVFGFTASIMLVNVATDDSFALDVAAVEEMLQDLKTTR